MTTTSPLPTEQGNASYLGARPDLVGIAARLTDWSRALDVGCAEGALGDALQGLRSGAVVTGIELDPEMAARARTHLARVVLGDAEAALLQLDAEGQTFDLVVCGDVLEHLVDPWAALARIRRLCPDGHVILSLPNVGHWTTWYSVLVRGHWPYRDRGIHDRTHLRFFARRNLEELASQAGFELINVRAARRWFERPGRLSEWLGQAIGWLPGLRRLTTYQFLCVLR